MTDRDFERAFGAKLPQTPFVERTTRSNPANDDEEAALCKSYKAYGFLPTNTVGETCDIRRWIDGTDIAVGVECQYRFLLRVAYSGDTDLRLFFPDFAIVVRGQNLRELRRKLARRQVTFVQQYSPRIWPEGPELGQPLVEALHLTYPSGQ